MSCGRRLKSTLQAEARATTAEYEAMRKVCDTTNVKAKGQTAFFALDASSFVESGAAKKVVSPLGLFIRDQGSGKWIL
jgi:hypothetical protein